MAELGVRLRAVGDARPALSEQRDLFVIHANTMHQQRRSFEHTKPFKILDRRNAGRLPIDAASAQAFSEFACAREQHLPFGL